MTELDSMRDREEVVNTVNALFLAVDERDWAAARACLADRVHFDVTSLGAPEAVEMSAEDIIDGWQGGLASLEAIHHQSGNFRVRLDGDRAECFCYATAHHFRRVTSGRNTRVFVGSYDYRLARADGRWRITGFKFDAKFVEGNLELDKEAGANPESSP